MDEADAFWALCAMVELVLPSGMYSPQLHGLTVELRVLSDLLSRQLGSLTSHLQKAGISTELGCSKWILCSFINVMPLQVPPLTRKGGGERTGSGLGVGGFCRGLGW